MTTLNSAVARVLKRLHYPLDVILMCVRWYAAYPLSLRQLEKWSLSMAFALIIPAGHCHVAGAVA